VGGGGDGVGGGGGGHGPGGTGETLARTNLIPLVWKAAYLSRGGGGERERGGVLSFRLGTQPWYAYDCAPLPCSVCRASHHASPFTDTLALGVELCR
jgi:hypothetical protein